MREKRLEYNTIDTQEVLLIGAFQGQWNTINKRMEKNNKNNF